MRACIFDDGRWRIVTGKNRRRRTQVLGQLDHLQDALALSGRQPLQRRRLDVYSRPVDVELRREPGGAAHHALTAGLRTDAAQERGFGLPDALDRLLGAVGLDVFLDAVGGAAQRKLAQRDQIAFAEEILRGALCLLREIDLAGFEASQQFVGGDVDQHHLVRSIEECVGQRLPDADPGDATHDIVQALEVLHVERGEDVDAAVEQFLHILPALGMPRTLSVAVGQLVDQYQIGMPRDGGIQIEFLERVSPVFELLQWQSGQALQQCRRLASAVRLDHAHQDIAPFLLELASRDEHGKRLSDSGRGAEVDAQLSASGLTLLLLNVRQQGVRIGSVTLGCGHASKTDYGNASSARLSLSTFTPGSPRTPSWRPSVFSATRARTLEGSSLRTRATRLT